MTAKLMMIYPLDLMVSSTVVFLPAIILTMKGTVLKRSGCSCSKPPTSRSERLRHYHPFIPRECKIASFPYPSLTSAQIKSVFFS